MNDKIWKFCGDTNHGADAKMKKLILIVVISISAVHLHAQTLFDKVWVQGGGVSFTSTFNGTNVINAYLDTLFSPYFTAGNSNICDKDGNLILISDGFNVYNSQVTLIDNGDSIVPSEIMNKYNCSLASQSSIFLPLPNNKYCLITPTASDSEILNYWDVPSNGRALFDLLLYNVIDMNANSGQGKVIKKEMPLLQNVKLSKTNMMACKHGDGINWWLFKQAHDTNMVYKFLVTEASIYNYGLQGFAEPHFGKWDQSGQAMFSQQGDKYAVCIRGGGEQAQINPPPVTPGKISVADFDRCTGMLSNPKVYATHPASCHDIYDTACYENFTQGLCFSPNGRFLYVSSYYNIKQLDLLDNDTNTQWSLIHGLDTPWVNFNLYSSLYLGPNNKLYVGHYGSLSYAMSVINNPDVKGVGCNFCEMCLPFPKYGAADPPCMPNYHLGAAPVGGNCWPLGISETVSQANEISVYPNPSTGELNIIADKILADVWIRIVNITGETILQREGLNGGRFTFDISSRPQGIYFVEIKTDNEIKRMKLVKE